MIKTLPQYKTNQVVSFLGGMGKILNYRPDSGTWAYAIEMEMGEPPETGRVGPETTILLYEMEIEGVNNS